jgi:acyl-CoA:acyl-CoA alkyltransferase
MLAWAFKIYGFIPSVKIEGIAAVFPSRRISNGDILEMIVDASRDSYPADLNKSGVLRRVRHLLVHSGIRYRRWSSPGESPVQLLAQAISEALAQGGYVPRDVDCLIYTGMGGGFSEPGNSHMIAHALGMRHAQCFDIRDACNSWCRALQLIYHSFRGDCAMQRVLVVNAEFNMYPGGPGVPDLFCLRDAAEINWRLPAYTIGEAATATLLATDPAREWEFHFSSRTDLADLCVIPEENYRGYCALGLRNNSSASAEKIGRNGPRRFTSFGAELSAHGMSEAINIFRRLTTPRDSIKRIFPHASSKRDWDAGADVLGVRDLLFHIYPDYGNVVAASVPAGIALALERGEIARGDRLVAWIGSAGMSFSACSFVF